MFINNNFVIYAFGKYHPQTFLECKYMKKKIKTNNYTDKELESESESDSDSDNGIYIDSDNGIYIDSDNEE